MKYKKSFLITCLLFIASLWVLDKYRNSSPVPAPTTHLKITSIASGPHKYLVKVMSEKDNEKVVGFIIIAEKQKDAIEIAKRIYGRKGKFVSSEVMN